MRSFSPAWGLGRCPRLRVTAAALLCGCVILGHAPGVVLDPVGVCHPKLAAAPQVLAFWEGNPWSLSCAVSDGHPAQSQLDPVWGLLSLAWESSHRPDLSRSPGVRGSGRIQRPGRMLEWQVILALSRVGSVGAGLYVKLGSQVPMCGYSWGWSLARGEGTAVLGLQAPLGSVSHPCPVWKMLRSGHAVPGFQSPFLCCNLTWCSR